MKCPPPSLLEILHLHILYDNFKENDLEKILIVHLAGLWKSSMGGVAFETTIWHYIWYGKTNDLAPGLSQRVLCSTQFRRTGMNTVLAIGFFVMIFYFIIQFAQQDHVEEYYEDAIIDIEGRLEWARTRSSFPFGMKSQLEVSCKLLGEAKKLWKGKKWYQAYRVALQSQEAMNKAQSIYCSAIKTHQQSGHDYKGESAHTDCN